MHSESSAFVRCSIVARADSANAVFDGAAVAWDVRATALVDELSADTLLIRLLTAGVHGVLLAEPTVIRTAPAVSTPWLRSLHSVRVPVEVRLGRTVSTGYIDVMPVGVGTAEIVVCLRRASRWARRRTLRRLADEVVDRLVG